MTGKIREALEGVIRCFESGDIPEAIAYGFFPAPDLPSAKWSLLNRILVLISGTADARGFRQWMAVKRYVRKGARAIYILVPRFVQAENEEGETEEALAGFLARPVFRVEDTEGEPLSYQKAMEPSKLPLFEKAQEWGISVKAVPGNFQYYGYFCKDRMEIGLATKEEAVFFHELAHAAHSKLKGNLETREWEDEVVAELTAAALCRMVGRTSRFLGNNYRYISHYANKANTTPLRACLLVMGDVQKVLAFILHDKVEFRDPVGQSSLSVGEGAIEKSPCEPLPEGMDMRDGELATPRPLACIGRLASETKMKVAKPLEEMPLQEASKLTGGLTDKAQRQHNRQQRQLYKQRGVHKQCVGHLCNTDRDCRQSRSRIEAAHLVWR